jgi:hypothetical protein
VARLGRGQPTHAIIINSAARKFLASTSLAEFVTASSFPPLTVTSPSIAFTLAEFVTASSFPSLTVDYDTAFTLAEFVTASSFPSLTVDVPILPGQFITGDYQIEWARILLGPSPYYIVDETLEGWDDLPEVDSGNAPRTQRHGSWSGPDFSHERVVSAVIAISDTSGGFLGARRDLRRVINVSEDGAEHDLVIRTDGEVLRTKAKVQGRLMPTARYRQGFTPVSIRWVCSDPRRYDLKQQSVTVDVGGQAICVNDGDIATSPTIKINGPVVNPSITNQTLMRILAFTITLDDTQQLVIDTNAGTVTLNGDDRMDALSQQSVPVEAWWLAAGSNIITWSAVSGGGNPIELLFSSAHL